MIFRDQNSILPKYNQQHFSFADYVYNSLLCVGGGLQIILHEQSHLRIEQTKEMDSNHMQWEKDPRPNKGNKANHRK